MRRIASASGLLALVALVLVIIINNTRWGQTFGPSILHRPEQRRASEAPNRMPTASSRQPATAKPAPIVIVTMPPGTKFGAPLRAPAQQSVGVSVTPSAQVIPSPTISPTPQAPSGTAAAPSSAPSAPDEAGATATVHTQQPPGVPFAAPHDPVRIEKVQLSSTVVHGGDVVTGSVVTTSNVASVTARLAGFEVAVPKVAPGKFEVGIVVPHMLLFRHRFDVVVTAIGVDARDQRVIPIQVYY